VPKGGPAAVARTVRDRLPVALPDRGVGAEQALRTVVELLAEGAADPADPLCAAHLHTAPLAVATAADLAASAVNASLDSWDQAPAASEVERLVTDTVARLVHRDGLAPDALVTTGATESNLVALLLARELHGPSLQVVCSAEAHHSVWRAAWLLGLPEPVLVPTVGGVVDVAAVADAMTRVPGPHFVVATAGTTDRGVLDPIPPLAELASRHGGHLHVDAAYGGGLLFGGRRHLLTGIDHADTVALDLHKFGWQPLPAGLLTVRSTRLLDPLGLVADYLNADDDQQGGFPDLLGRAIRTSRRPDAVKLAVTFQALGRAGLAELTDRCCDAATELAAMIRSRPGLRLAANPPISTVLFRPTVADALPRADGNALVAELRRSLLVDGAAVLGRATLPDDGLVWLKITLLNPEVTSANLTRLLDLVEHAVPGQKAA
jgi:L-2,4-diaminobutyrate decarboxylase